MSKWTGAMLVRPMHHVRMRLRQTVLRRGADRRLLLCLQEVNVADYLHTLDVECYHRKHS
jgi:hypothetical protein